MNICFCCTNQTIVPNISSVWKLIKNISCLIWFELSKKGLSTISRENESTIGF